MNKPAVRYLINLQSELTFFSLKTLNEKTPYSQELDKFAQWEWADIFLTT